MELRSNFISVFLLILVCYNKVSAQDTTDQKFTFYIGTEIQAYPTGAIPGIFFEVVKNNSNSLHAKFGYNVVRHRDLGVHDLERGGGYGFTLGYKRYLRNEGLKGFYLGARSDMWFNKVDWEDYESIDEQPQVLTSSGRSDIVVLQPTLLAGYQLSFGSDRLSFSPQIAFGWEINVITKRVEAEWNEQYLKLIADEPSSLDPSTGQGAIFLAGFSMAFRIN